MWIRFGRSERCGMTDSAGGTGGDIGGDPPEALLRRVRRGGFHIWHLVFSEEGPAPILHWGGTTQGIGAGF